MKDVPAKIGIGLILVYRATLSPLLGSSCRYTPSCSRYTETAVRRFGLLRGSWIGLRRILRCHPFHSGGYDPVPVSSGTDGIETPIETDAERPASGNR